MTIPQQAHEIVSRILTNLSNRKGIGDELDQIDDDIRVEIEMELVDIVEECLGR